MIKILFLIHDLGQGGAEKVLVNLVNNMDRTKFDITVMALFGGGVNEQFLKNDITYKTVYKKAFPGNSKVMKIFSPEQLHKKYIKEEYDIEVSYLEGPSARIISGCPDSKTKLVSWIHVQQNDMATLAASFRSEEEAKDCYERFHHIVCVSEDVKKDFCKILQYKKTCAVLYNTVESEQINEQSREALEIPLEDGGIKLVAVGTLKPSKGYKRLINIVYRLLEEQYKVHMYILGIGPQKDELEKLIDDKGISKNVTFLGYQTNPYKYIKKCDLFVCASYAEGFSTAATEALIVGTPVCTVEVSGMKEMLGENNDYGIITENNEADLYQGIKRLLDDPEQLAHYRAKATERGRTFSTENTVRGVEDMLKRCVEK